MICFSEAGSCFFVYITQSLLLSETKIINNTCSYKHGVQEYKLIYVLAYIHVCISDSLFLLCHSAGMAPVHPSEGQPVYHDEPRDCF